MKDEEYIYKIFIDSAEFQGKILECIGSEEFNKQFASTVFSTFEDEEQRNCKQAMMHGMVIASLMTCKCEPLCVKEKIVKEEV